MTKYLALDLASITLDDALGCGVISLLSTDSELPLAFSATTEKE